MAEVRSGSFVTKGYSDPGWPDHYVFSWSLTSQSVVNNTSTISWSLKAAGGTDGSYFTYVKEKYVTVNGITKSNADITTTYNNTVAFSGTTTITHNSATGKGSFSASAGGAFYYYGSYNSTGSGSWELPTIARATTPTLSSPIVQLTKTITVTMAPANSTFKHKLRYNFKNISGSADGISIGADFSAQGTTTATFTPPASLGSQIPSSVIASGEIVCYTYTSDGTHIGTKSVPVQIEIPSYTPSITNITLTGNVLLGGAYVQGKSTVTVNANVATQYSATAKSISAVVDGKTYNSLPFTTSALSAGSKTVKITFTDSRNQTVTTESAAFTVYAYAAPAITSFTLERDAVNGSTVIATVKGSVASVNNKNAKTIKVVLGGVTNTITSSSYTINGTTTFTNVSTDETLTGTATITDSYTSTSKNAVLPTVAVTMDFHHSGNGAAFGKVAEDADLLDVAWAVRSPRVDSPSVPYLLGGYGTNITQGANLNSTDFLKIGNYVCNQNSIAASLTNCPTTSAFKMTVSNVIHKDPNPDSTNDWYLVREITNLYGYKYYQHAHCNASTGWSFGVWYAMLDNFNVSDFITEQGASDGWEYVKWSSGKAEAWRKDELGSIELTTSMVEGVYSNTTYAAKVVALPTGLFADAPSAYSNVACSGYTISQVSSITTTQIRYRLWSPYSTTINSTTISLRVIGKWK